MAAVMLPSRTGRLLSRPLAALGLALASVACANGGVIEEPSGSPAASGGGGEDGRGGSAGDDDSGSGKSSGKGPGGTQSGGTPGGTQSGGGSAGDGGSDQGGSGPGSGGDASSSTGLSTNASSSGTGVDCTIDADCFDGDPCTLETCDAISGCAQAPIAAGQLATTEGAGCDGVCQPDGSCGWSLYERTFAAGQPFSRRALGEAWAGANAPPPRGILAAETIFNRDALFVFADDGMTYLRVDGLWQAPLVTVDAFAGIEATDIDCASAYQFSPDGTPFMFIKTSAATRRHWTFSFDAANVPSLLYDPFDETSGGDAGAPPYGLYDCDVGFMYQTAYYVDSATPWLQWWEGYNGNVHMLDYISYVWTAYGAQTASPLWASMPGGPAAGATRDIYFDAGKIAFVAP